MGISVIRFARETAGLVMPIVCAHSAMRFTFWNREDSVRSATMLRSAENARVLQLTVVRPAMPVFTLILELV